MSQFAAWVSGKGTAVLAWAVTPSPLGHGTQQLSPLIATYSEAADPRALEAALGLHGAAPKGKPGDKHGARLRRAERTDRSERVKATIHRAWWPRRNGRSKERGDLVPGRIAEVDAVGNGESVDRAAGVAQEVVTVARSDHRDSLIALGRREMVEAALAHVVGNEVEAAHARSDL